MIFKICFWLNTPTHHQSSFLEALNDHDEINLQVRFFGKVTEERKKLGWKNIIDLPENQKFISNLDDGIQSLIDWKDRIHIVSGYGNSFNLALIDLFIEKDVQWCHWSERSGVGLAKKVNYSTLLFKLLKPIFLYTKHSYGKKVNKYALGAFALGELAQKDLITMGINKQKIEYLFYALQELQKDDTLILNTKKEDKTTFLYVGSLYKGKGIDVLINAFSKLDHSLCELILVGPDMTKGVYVKLVKSLNLEKNVKFIGSVSSNEINKYMSYSDVFVLPSRYDGWGAVLNEAASLGLPLIATDQCGAAYHIIKNDFNGYMVKAGEVNSLKNAMEKYIINNKLIPKHGNESKKIFQSFTPEKNAQRFIESVKKWTERKYI